MIGCFCPKSVSQSNCLSKSQAQEQKLDLLATLLQLRPGQRILDVGCGWGGPLVYLAETYGVRGVGLTLSPAQREYAERRVREHDVDVASRSTRSTQTR